MSNGNELRIPAGATLQVSKALAQLDFVAGRYGRVPLLTPADRRKYAHDFEVILTFGNLRQIGAEFLSKGTIVGALWVRFDPTTGRLIDSNRGVESPFIPRGVVDDHRVLMVEREDAKAPLYRRYLAIPWSAAEKRPQARGERFQSDHAAAITGHNCSAEFFVGEFARHRGRIFQVSPAGDWAKAWDGGEMKSVFLHKRYALDGLQFARNLFVTYVLVGGPRGFQGRNIKAA